jgi:hypothetical protein
VTIIRNLAVGAAVFLPASLVARPQLLAAHALHPWLARRPPSLLPAPQIVLCITHWTACGFYLAGVHSGFNSEVMYGADSAFLAALATPGEFCCALLAAAPVPCLLLRWRQQR